MIRRKRRAEREVVAARMVQAQEATEASQRARIDGQRVGERLDLLMQQLRDLNQANNFAEKMRQAYGA